MRYASLQSWASTIVHITYFFTFCVIFTNIPTVHAYLRMYVQCVCVYCVYFVFVYVQYVCSYICAYICTYVLIVLCIMYVHIYVHTYVCTYLLTVHICV